MVRARILMYVSPVHQEQSLATIGLVERPNDESKHGRIVEDAA